jgi:hypothetical protein
MAVYLLILSWNGWLLPCGAEPLTSPPVLAI